MSGTQGDKDEIQENAKECREFRVCVLHGAGTRRVGGRNKLVHNVHNSVHNVLGAGTRRVGGGRNKLGAR